MLKEFAVSTKKRNELVDITSDVGSSVGSSGIKQGICVVYSPHTTAAITINESADPDVRKDVLMKLSKMVPEDEGYLHAEGNSDSHIKSSIVGCSEMLIIKDGKLELGIWQSIYFAEFDGPRERTIFIKIMSDEN